MSDEEEKPVGDVSADTLEAVFAPEEVLVEEEEVFVIVTEEEEDDVDLAFQEDEGYW
jgi:hypothetical protein